MRKYAILFAFVAAVGVLGGWQAQPEKENAKTKQPAAKEQSKRVGDAYPLATCPISGKKLGSMGDPIVKVYDGREVRYCCDGCPESFEKDLKASFAKLDEKITKDQAPIYPTKVSIVSGKELPAKPVEFVAGNRLFRVASDTEKAEVLKDTKKYLAELDKAVVKAQGGDYPLKNCPVSKDELGGMGEAKDVVVAGRLIRLCCNDCRKDLEKEPAKFVAQVDDARKAAHK